MGCASFLDDSGEERFQHGHLGSEGAVLRQVAEAGPKGFAAVFLAEPVDGHGAGARFQGLASKAHRELGEGISRGLRRAAGLALPPGPWSDSPPKEFG